eukprot:scaffold328_cov248-Pinguiococcus_pyrenoidosus.AAC.3
MSLRSSSGKKEEVKERAEEEEEEEEEAQRKTANLPYLALVDDGRPRAVPGGGPGGRGLEGGVLRRAGSSASCPRDASLLNDSVVSTELTLLVRSRPLPGGGGDEGGEAYSL